jgi:hypothetical protein
MQNGLNRLTRQMTIGFCALYLTACAPRYAVRTEIITPPPSLLASCDKPEPGEMATNGDLARYASALRYALDTCAAKIDAIKLFYDVDKTE